MGPTCRGQHRGVEGYCERTKAPKAGPQQGGRGAESTFLTLRQTSNPKRWEEKQVSLGASHCSTEHGNLCRRGMFPDPSALRF